MICYKIEVRKRKGVDKVNDILSFGSYCIFDILYRSNKRSRVSFDTYY